ncbi:MAG: hypothetical protein NT169_16170 [Chloroflexi bacterium]|nr:hypothetical protein [Chloroflexota bacterium]
MIEYVTTNIRLPKELYREAKPRAAEEEKSLAQVIRESVAQYLVGQRSIELESTADPVTDDWENDPLWLIGTDATIADVTDGSVNHDLYLYSPLSKKARAESRK